MSKSKPLPSLDILNKTFTYDPITGILAWKDRPDFHHRTNARLRGKPAGSQDFSGNSNGRLKVSINGVKYMVHRLIYYMYYELIPDVIDHKDGDPSNNKIENLRSVTTLLNGRNLRRRVVGCTGVTGVYFEKKHNKYAARIYNNERVYLNLGLFGTIEEAKNARDKVKDKYGYTDDHGYSPQK
ncbi:HNH endonuclease [Sphingobacterium mizutaii]|uniref:HNH endonuclease n=1 Tax=Sphingobacterium mizutaii TaxID=1010 RepID=UPI0028A00DA3|nr:HNH endonuclease [Sphingobacterium mizutaii]